MDRIRKILVPVDFSECSRPALDQAIGLARKTSAELTLMHVWQEAAFLAAAREKRDAAETTLAFSSSAYQRAQRELGRLASEAFGRGVPVKTAWYGRGVPSRLIVDVARNGNFDLAVMGTHGLSGLDHALVGSVVEKVLRRAPCPVLSVRPGLGFPREIRRILAPVDLSECSGLVLRTALDLATLLGAEIRAVHVWDRPAWVSDSLKVHVGGTLQPLHELVIQNEQRSLEEFLASVPGSAGKVSHRLLTGEPVAAVLKELEQGGYDLCVLATHGRSGIRHLLLGSVTEKLVRLAKVPVLTVPPRVRA